MTINSFLDIIMKFWQLSQIMVNFQLKGVLWSTRIFSTMSQHVFGLSQMVFYFQCFWIGAWEVKQTRRMRGSLPKMFFFSRSRLLEEGTSLLCLSEIGVSIHFASLTCHNQDFDNACGQVWEDHGRFLFFDFLIIVLKIHKCFYNRNTRIKKDLASVENRLYAYFLR